MDRWTDGLVEPHLPQTPSRILDVGCGSALLIEKLRGLGHDAWGLDINAPRHPFIIKGDMEEPPRLFSQQQPFDLIFCFETLEHIIHDYEALVAMQSWLKPGGKLILSTPNEKGGEDYPKHIRHYMAWSLKRLLDYAGFIDIEVSVNPENQASLLVKALKETVEDCPICGEKVNDINDHFVKCPGYAIFLSGTEKRRLMRRALLDAFHEKTFQIWKETEYGEILGSVASLVKLLMDRGVDGLRDLAKDAFPCLMTMTALVAEKAEHYYADEHSVRNIMMTAFGFYVKVEPYKMDTWKDLPLRNLILHLGHEVEEIKRGKTEERRMHNAIDALALEAMIWLRKEEMELGSIGLRKLINHKVKQVP